MLVRPMQRSKQYNFLRACPVRRCDVGGHFVEELTAAVRSACEYLRATDTEKQKLAEQFRKRGGVYKQFIDDALAQQPRHNR